MGNRSYLTFFIDEDKLSKGEAQYYREYIQSSDDTYYQLADKAKAIESVWNENFNYMPNQIPSCLYVRSNGKLYFSPDESFSKEEDLVFSVHNHVPEPWANLFTDTEFKHLTEYKGKEYPSWMFQSTAKEVLERLTEYPELMADLRQDILDTLQLVPEDSILQLTFNEIPFEDLPERLKMIIVQNRGILATFVNDDGIEFNIHVVFEGDRYGRDDCLLHDKKDPFIEFYDARYDFDKHGQFVTRYLLSSLMKSRDKLERAGLLLDGGIPNWKLSASNMRGLYRYLEPIESIYSIK